MIGLGKKDEDGKQVRIEHLGKYTRASRTDGIAVRAEKKLGPVNLTANSSNGLRASTRVSNGAQVALQNGRFQLFGRWKAGPLGFNLSKTGVSASVKRRFRMCLLLQSWRRLYITERDCEGVRSEILPMCPRGKAWLIWPSSSTHLLIASWDGGLCGPPRQTLSSMRWNRSTMIPQ